jgi:hypothetical protein
MNVFYLDHDPKTCAEMHCDKHTVKMIIEYAQLMSTAHRVLDGEEYFDKTANGRKIRRWRMKDPKYESGLMLACHVNHPSNVWVRANHLNYKWLYEMWCYLLDEYTYRYGKVHACARLRDDLAKLPEKIPVGLRETEPPPAMPDYCKVPGDSITSYQTYYINEKVRFARWTKRETPVWYQNGINTNNANLQLL